MRTKYQYQRESETGEGTRQRAFLARGMPVENNEDQRPPEQQRALNACGHQGGEGGRGTPRPAACTYGAQTGARGGPPDMAAHACIA